MTATDHPGPVTPVARGSPFVGLQPYGADSAHLFFGREQASRIITANLRSARLTLLYGASGVGKSSVLRAAVVHDLRARLAASAARPSRAGTAAPQFAVTYFSEWRDAQPLERLMSAIRAEASEAAGDALRPWTPGQDPVETLKEWTTHVRTLLVVLDQFEELFVYHGHDDGPGTFLGEFPKVVNESGLHVNFLVALREDAWAKLDRFKATIPGLFSNYLRLDYLDRDGGRRSIERSVEAFNAAEGIDGPPYVVTPELTEAVLDGVQTGAASLAEAPVAETGGQPSQRIETPFLQLVMQRLWDATVEQGSHVLELETLRELGGPQEIVRRHLERAMDRLDDGEQEVAAAAFRFLVTAGRGKIAQQVSDLADWTGFDQDRVTAVLEHMAEGRSGRVVRPLPPNPGEKSPRYEIFHDVLADPVVDWRKRYENNRAAAERERRQEELDRERLEEERRRHTAQVNRVIRWSAVGLTVLALGLVAAIFVVIHERSIARSQRRAAAAMAQLPVDPERSLLLAREAMREHDTPEARAALAEALGTSPVRKRYPGPGPLIGATVSSDGRLVATQGRRAVQLWRTASAGRLGPPLTPGGDVAGAVVSADGSRVAAAGSGGAVVAPVGGRGVSLPADAPVHSVALSADGKLVATSDRSGVTVWRAANGLSLARLPLRSPGIDAQFDPRDANRLIVAGCPAGGIRSWAWRTGATRVLERGSRQGGSSAPCYVSFGPGGRRVATALGRPLIHIWDGATGRAVSTLRGQDGGDLSSTLSRLPASAAVAWSADGRRIAVADFNYAEFWDVDTGGTPFNFAEQDQIYAVAFSADGTILATASRDGTATAYDVDHGTAIAQLRGHLDSINSIAFVGGTEKVVTASADGTARLWDLSLGRAVRPGGVVAAAAWDASDRRVATARADGTAQIWSADGRERHTLTNATVPRPTTVEFDRSGTRVFLAGAQPGAAGELTGVAQLLDARTDRSLWSFRDKPVADVRRADLAPNGREVVIAESDGATVWDGPSGKRLGVLGPSGTTAASFSRDGTRIVTAGLDGQVRVFDAHSLRRQHTIDTQGRLVGAVFSPDGKKIVSYGFDRVARVWDLHSKRPRAVMSGHTSWIASAVFTPDGKRVVTAGRDHTIRIWDADSGTLLGVREPHADIINSVAVSHDGRWILSASDDGTARITSASVPGSIGGLMALAKQNSTRQLSDVERRDLAE